MQTFKVELEVRFTDDDMEDIPFGTAVYYWGAIFHRRDTEMVGIEVIEHEDSKIHNVSYDDIRKAFGRLVTNRNMEGKPYDVADYIMGYFTAAVRDGEDGGIDLGHIDTDAADILLQVAIWDEVIYG